MGGMPKWGAVDLSPIRPTSTLRRVSSSSSTTESSSDENPSIHFTPQTDILFLHGYRYDRGSSSVAEFEGTCPLCAETGAVLTLLLKTPPKDIVTSGFPGPHSRSGLAFPLAMGTFPETDILSSFVCCDACAYYLVQMKKSPYAGEEIVDAIPLIPESLSGTFQETTFNKVDNALLKRFERPAVEQVFLAVVYSTLDNLEGDFNGIEKEALAWACLRLSLLSSIPATLSTSFSSDSSSLRGPIPLPVALSQSLDELSKPSPLILQYPLGGFVVMIRSMMDLNLEPRPNARKDAVFQRILYHLTEKVHATLLTSPDSARTALLDLIKMPLTLEHATQNSLSASLNSNKTSNNNSLVSRLSIPIVMVRDTYLFSIEDWEILQRLGPLFNYVKDDCGSAITIFLCMLTRIDTTGLTTMEIFDRIRSMKELSAVFESPQDIGESEASSLLNSV